MVFLYGAAISIAGDWNGDLDTIGVYPAEARGT
jgi:hypothetical protein